MPGFDPSFDVPKIDTSSYGGGDSGGQQLNPFGVMNQMAEFQSKMNQNALFQQQFVAKKAMGEIIQKSVNPDSGAPDWTKAGLLMSMDPRTAFMAPDFIKSLQDRSMLDQQIFGEKLKNAGDMMKLTGNILGPLAMQAAKTSDGLLPADPSDPSKADMKPLYSAFHEALGEYPEIMDHGFQQLVAIKGMSNRQEQTQAVMNMFKSSQMAAKGIDGVQQKLDIPVLGPNGEPNMVPGTMDLTSGQVSSPAMGASQGAAGTSLVNAPQETGTDGGTVEKKPEPLPPSGLQAGGGMFQTGLAPYKADAIKDIATKYEPELNDRVRDSNQLLLMMSQIKNELKDFTPGGGQTTYAKLAQFAQSIGIPPETFDKMAGATGGGLGSVQAANKLFFGIGSQMAAQLIRAGGGRMTQTEWGKTLTEGAPNIDMDPRAIARIFVAMKQMAHFNKMEQDGFNLYKKSGHDLTQWQNEWSGSGGLFDQIMDRQEKSRQNAK